MKTTTTTAAGSDDERSSAAIERGSGDAVEEMFVFDSSNSSSGAASIRSELAEQLQQAAMLMLWMIMMFAKLLLVFVPQQLPATSGIRRILAATLPDRIESPSSPGALSSWLGPPAAVRDIKTPICRALLQVLELMNEIPASSRKYAFTQELAEKIIRENASGETAGLEQVNRVALEAAFSRTVQLLTESLEESLNQQRLAGWNWATKLFKSLPASSIPLLPVITSLWTSSAPVPSPNTESEASEKFVQELLWMAHKLKENLAVEAAIVQWTSSASRLAALSHIANPRVQKHLVKLSAFLCSELACRESQAPVDLKFKFLLLWTPLFCNVSPVSGDGTAFTGAEKLEVERTLERIIASLPTEEQEAVLALWLREFSTSSSDWPNLRSCYEKWCQESRSCDQPSIKYLVGS